MKAKLSFVILEYELPEEREELEQALKGAALHSELWSFDQELRRRERHTDTVPDSWSQVREILREHVDLEF